MKRFLHPASERSIHDSSRCSPPHGTASGSQTPLPENPRPPSTCRHRQPPSPLASTRLTAIVARPTRLSKRSHSRSHARAEVGAGGRRSICDILARTSRENMNGRRRPSWSSNIIRRNTCAETPQSHLRSIIRRERILQPAMATPIAPASDHPAPVRRASPVGRCATIASRPPQRLRPIPALTPALAARFSSTVIVAPKPAMPIPGGVAGPGLLAQVIVSKYADHLPLYRLEGIFAAGGALHAADDVRLVRRCAKLLTPLTELIREEVLSPS